jgi:hypothetical protein
MIQIPIVITYIRITRIPLNKAQHRQVGGIGSCGASAPARCRWDRDRATDGAALLAILQTMSSVL